MNFREWARSTHQALAHRPAEDRGEHLTHAQVETIMRMAVSTLVEALASGDGLQLDALGCLWVENRGARRLVSNLTSEQRKIYVPARRVVRFRPSKCLKSALNTK